MMLTIDATTTDVDAGLVLLERQVDYLAGLVTELLVELDDDAA